MLSLKLALEKIVGIHYKHLCGCHFYFLKRLELKMEMPYTYSTRRKNEDLFV